MARQLVRRPIEVQIEDSLLTQLLNPEFITEFRKVFPGSKFGLLRIAIPKQEKGASAGPAPKQPKEKTRPPLELVTVFHAERDHDEKRILTVAAEDPETLEAIERILANLPAPT